MALLLLGWEANVKIKTHLVKALVIPILDYPPVPIHTASVNQTKILQKLQNKALRFATNQKYPYTRNTKEIHEDTNMEALNIRLHKRSQNIWHRLEELRVPAFTKLQENSNNITRYHRDYQSSLQKRFINPNPIF